jgi:hypothetical protein
MSPGDVCYHIWFSSQNQFEAVWPSLLKVRKAGSPVILLPSSPAATKKVEAIIYCDSFEIVNEQVNPKMRASSISLTVDGHIVDLNRIPLPANTPIIDERFNDSKRESLRR